MTYTISVFISHSWSYSEHYERLKEWIFGNNWRVGNVPLFILNTSVPRDDPIHSAPTDSALYDQILRRIIMSDLVICPTGMYSTHSKWIGKEITACRHTGTPLVAVNPWGQERKSSIVLANAIEEVGWNKQSVIDAVYKYRSK
jgi:hypothetical protein